MCMFMCINMVYKLPLLNDLHSFVCLFKRKNRLYTRFPVSPATFLSKNTLNCIISLARIRTQTLFKKDIARLVDSRVGIVKHR